jgi:hypothetical protein
MKFPKCFSLILAVLMFIFHFADLASDIVACITYNQNGFDAYYKASLAFIIIPFIYVVFYAQYETGGFENLGYCEALFYSLLNYLFGPLFPVFFSGKINESNMKKFTAFLSFGTAYMEDIPQVVIAGFFLFSREAGKSQSERIIGFLQLVTSAVSGIYKLFSGAAKLGDNKVNICGQNVKCCC